MSFKFGRGQALSLAHNIVHSLPHIEKTGVSPPPPIIPQSIYAKALVWWELDETGTPVVPLVDLIQIHGDSRYNFEFGGSPVALLGQPTLRSGGVHSMLFGPGTNSGNIMMAGQAFITEITTGVDFSLVTWIKPLASTSTTNPRCIISQNNSAQDATAAGNTQFAFNLHTDGRPYAQWEHGTHVAVNPFSTLTVAANTVYFLGYSKTVGDTSLRHYTNGALQNTVVFANDSDGGSNQKADLAQRFYFIGAGLTPAESYLQGLAMFSPALTADEHAFLYNGGIGYSWAEIKTLAGH